MTLQKLIDKYMKLTKQGYETITIAQVITDLRYICVTTKSGTRRALCHGRGKG